MTFRWVRSPLSGEPWMFLWRLCPQWRIVVGLRQCQGGQSFCFPENEVARTTSCLSCWVVRWHSTGGFRTLVSSAVSLVLKMWFVHHHLVIQSLCCLDLMVPCCWLQVFVSVISVWWCSCQSNVLWWQCLSFFSIGWRRGLPPCVVYSCESFLSISRFSVILMHTFVWLRGMTWL